MTIGYRDTAGESESAGDPLFPWLMKIKNSAEDLYSGTNSGEDLDKLLYDCISTCKQDARYRNDLRFLKIWFLYVITTTLKLFELKIVLPFPRIV